MGSRTYRQLCSVARALDLVGERWTLLLIRDLLLGPQGYNQLLAGLPGLTTNLLAKRLKSLIDLGLIQKDPAPSEDAARALYCLTAAGKDLGPVVSALGDWGQAHGRQRQTCDALNIRLLLVVLGRHYRRARERWIVQVTDHAGSIQFRLGGADFEGVEGTPMRPDLIVEAGSEALQALVYGDETPDQLVQANRIRLTASDPAANVQAIWHDFLFSFQLNAS